MRVAGPEQVDADELLNRAAELIHRDPGAARRLAETCSGAPGTLSARADYLCAQAHAIEGDLDGALLLIERARAAFFAAGAPIEALRTDVGRMHVLNEQGRHEEAIRTGEQALRALADGARVPGLDPQHARVLRAKSHHNLSICHAFAGRYGRAAEEGRRAEEAYLAAGLPGDVASLHQNRGEQLLDVGRAAEALPLLRRAGQEFGATAEALFEARCHVAAGRAGMLLGRWTDALDDFARARELFEALDVRADLDQVLLRTGEAWRALGLHDEALVAYGEAEPSLRSSGQLFYLAQVRSGSGWALAQAGRLVEAQVALAEAAQLHRAAGNVPLLAQVLLEMADVHDRCGQRDQARAAAATAVELLGDGEWEIQRVYAHLRAADLAHPDLTAAQDHLERAAPLVASLGLAPLAFRLDARLGRVHRLRGQAEEGHRRLTAACAAVEQLRASLPTETLRTSFLRDAAAPYLDLMALELDRGDVAAAFAAADRSKSRTLVDLLSSAPGTPPPGSGVNAGRASLEEELLALYSQLLHADADHGPRGRALQERAAHVEAQLREDQLRGGPAGPARIGAPLPLVDLQARLDPDVVVVAYHVLDDEVLAFVATHDRLHAVRSVTSLSLLRPLLRRLEAQWARFRPGPAFSAGHGGRLLASAVQLLQELHRRLITPLGELPCDARLVVIPHGPLHGVPFHALHDGQHYLLEKHEVSTSPSASVLGRTLSTPRACGPPLVLGVADAAAPEMEREARAVAAVLPHARLRTGAAASRDTLLREAAGSSVVHLACHGLHRPESPMFSSLHLADGWLTAGRLTQLDLTGAVVALSGCETGRTTAHGAGDEALGLARTTLGTGAAAVLVSLWMLPDETTARLMARWYELLAGGYRRAQALRLAQLERLAEQPHPYHWAPLVLVGAP